MNQKQYLQKLKWRLSFKLPGAVQRKVLGDAEMLLQERSNDEEGMQDVRVGRYKEFAGNISWEKNYRWLFFLISLLTFVISGHCFLSIYSSGSVFELPYMMDLSPVLVVASFAAGVWFLFGIDCFWADCYTYNKKKFAVEQLCFFIFAVLLQVVVYWIIPDMVANMQLILVSTGVRYGMFVLLILLVAVLDIQAAQGRWQAYFSLVQVFGILCSMVAYNYILLNVDELGAFLEHPFIMTPYVASVFADIVFYCLLRSEVDMDSQVREML